MKKFLLTAAALCGVALISGAAEKAAAAATTPAPVEPKVTAPAQCEAEQLRPLSQWTPFQIVFFPNVPNATWNSNVFGIKTGQPENPADAAGGGLTGFSGWRRRGSTPAPTTSREFRPAGSTTRTKLSTGCSPRL